MENEELSETNESIATANKLEEDSCEILKVETVREDTTAQKESFVDESGDDKPEDQAIQAGNKHGTVQETSEEEVVQSLPIEEGKDETLGDKIAEAGIKELLEDIAEKVISKDQEKTDEAEHEYEIKLILEEKNSSYWTLSRGKWIKISSYFFF